MAYTPIENWKNPALCRTFLHPIYTHCEHYKLQEALKSMATVRTGIPELEAMAQAALPRLPLPDLAYTPEVAAETAHLYERVEVGTRVVVKR